MRLGVLVSGRGSNLQALLDASKAGRLGAEIAVVVSNVEGAFALERAREAGIRAETLPHASYTDRAAFDLAMAEKLREHRVDLVCLAGFMRILGPDFLNAFPGRVINIHPSLLPAFPGMRAPRAAVEHGVRWTGCTVHFVDTGTDSGPILIQAAVPVLPDDDEARLAARILESEHRIYPEAIRLIAEGRVRVEGRAVRIAGAHAPETFGPLANPESNTEPGR